MSSDLTIYGHWVSQPSRAIMWILNMKNIPFKFVETSPQTGDTRKPEYLAKFPTHTIPAMECDGIIIRCFHLTFSTLLTRKESKLLKVMPFCSF